MGSESSKRNELRKGEVELELHPDNRYYETMPSIYNFMKLQELRKHLVPGDVVAVRRSPIINHYMVYLGTTKESIIHFYADDGKRTNFKSIMDYLSNWWTLRGKSSRGNYPGVIELSTLTKEIGDDDCSISNRYVNTIN